MTWLVLLDIDHFSSAIPFSFFYYTKWKQQGLLQRINNEFKGIKLAMVFLKSSSRCSFQGLEDCNSRVSQEKKSLDALRLLLSNLAYEKSHLLGRINHYRDFKYAFSFWFHFFFFFVSLLGSIGDFSPSINNCIFLSFFFFSQFFVDHWLVLWCANKEPSYSIRSRSFHKKNSRAFFHLVGKNCLKILICFTWKD